MRAKGPYLSTIREVSSACLCFAAQRAARRLARRFDRAFQPAGVSNNQFDALICIAVGGQTPGRLAQSLGMDRTAVTSLVKTLERRGLAASQNDAVDGRVRRLALTAEGRERLAAALPIWREEQARLEAALPADSLPEGRILLAALAVEPVTSPPAPAP
jgi:DNA-binding MarR family transcriptional regulator